jgi:CCR4-NOT transcription complex subunit 9
MTTAMVTPQQQQPSPDNERLYQWIVELSNPDIRENALLELSKKRESVHDLAPMLWHSFGTIASLLQVRSIGIIFCRPHN